jgi:hypothetical protein
LLPQNLKKNGKKKAINYDESYTLAGKKLKQKHIKYI